MTFSIDRCRVGPVEVIEISGELDTETGDLLIACTDASLAEVQHLVLDLSGTAFVDCGGLSALLRVGRSARRAGGVARAAGVQGPAALLFDVFAVWGVLGGRHSVHLEIRRAVRAAAAAATMHPASMHPAAPRSSTAPTMATACPSGG